MKLFNNRKKIYGTMLLLALVTIFAGCNEDFLDRQAQGSYNQDNYPYPGGSGPYDQFINGAYSTLNSYDVTVFAFVATTSMRSDDADKGSTAADSPNSKELDEFTVTPTNGLVNSLWLGHLNLVGKANYILDRIKNDPNPNTAPDLKIDAEAQARFFRAYAYFMLVRSYGRVPIIDSVTTGSASASNVPQSTPAQVYAFIENDLQYAAANLKPSYSDAFVGRITQGAANALLAKVYLQQKKYSLAMNTANLVMTSGQYDLSVDYSDIFDEEGENSKESILEVQATATPSVQTNFGTQYNQIQGVRGTGDWNLGWGFNVPSTALEAAYEANDPRKARTILYAGGKSLWGEDVPTGLPNPRYNNKISTPRDKQALIGSRSAWWMNIRLIRYADIVLVYAEAANEIGGAVNIAKAVDALNSVRARARREATVSGALPDIVSTDEEIVRNAIRHERRVELGMEHERFFDLVRYGTAATEMQAQGKSFTVGKHELLPIPQTQIDLSNGVLTQNFGY